MGAASQALLTEVKLRLQRRLLFVYGFIFSLKKWAYLKYERDILYFIDRLVGLSSPSLLLLLLFFFFKNMLKVAVLLTFIIYSVINLQSRQVTRTPLDSINE